MAMMAVGIEIYDAVPDGKSRHLLGFYLLVKDPTMDAVMKRALPCVLDSFLKGKSIQESLESFYKLHCPKFSDFVAGEEYRLDQNDAHGQYLDQLEILLEGRLGEFDITANCFVEVLSAMLEINDDVSKQVMEAMDLGFEDFGLLMRHKFDKLYGKVASSRATKLRILWDIENVPIPHRMNAFNVASAILSYCEGKYCEQGAQVDTLMTCFHCPEKRTLPRRVIRDLDRASIEQVLVSSKREDADRKIVSRIQREMGVLESGAIFVLISSDNDFVSSYQSLKGGGFVCHNIHNAPSADLVRALSLYCESCVSLVEVLASADEGAGLDVEDDAEAEVKGAGDGDGDEDEDVGKDYESGGVREHGDVGDDVGKRQSPGNRKNRKKKTKKKTNRFLFVEANRYSGYCCYWNSRKGFGFIKVDTDGAGKVFVHNLALPSASKFRFLNVGERVEMSVRCGEKGPFAENVVGADAGQLICEGETT